MVRLAATPPATTSVAPGVRQFGAEPDERRPRPRFDDIGGRALEAGADVGRILLAERRDASAASRTAVFSPENEKSSRSSRAAGAEGEAARVAGPGPASFSTCGPPGTPSPRSLATLSKASPSASSMVVPQRW
jgi:hypothetical protein